MRSDIIPGGIFPDYALPDHTDTVRTATPKRLTSSTTNRDAGASSARRNPAL